MRVRTVLVIVALVCGGLTVAARAEDKPAGTKKAPDAKPAAKPPGGGTYCCSSECCDLAAECAQNPKDCSGWHTCRQANNNCSCSDKCKYPPNVARQATETSKDPLVKAAGASSDCQWQCLTRLRSCLQKCTAKGSKTDCQTCTESYASCETRCGPPAAAATSK